MRAPRKIKIFESGRTLTETLTVLAIMGILSVVAIAGFQSLMNKHRANAIVNDAKVAYIESSARPSVADSDWQGVTYASESHKAIQIMRDKKGKDYVKVLGIEQKVCQNILAMAAENVLALLQEDYTELTTCSGNDNIVFAWNGVGVPAECNTSAECDVGEYAPGEESSGFPGFCNAEGHCQACNPDYETLNEDRTGCVCNPNKALICRDEEENEWCCGEGLICDIENKSCKDGGGACQYTFTQHVYEKAADCHYRISAQTQTKSANCHYTVLDQVKEGNLHEVILTQKQGCESDEYCYLMSFDSDCSTTINRGDVGATQAEDLWGVCLKRTANGAQCNVSSVSTNFMEEVKGCESDEYCYLMSFDSDCSTTINRGNVGATQTEDLWGVCLKRTANGAQCNQSTLSSGGLSETQGCPAGQYCYLKWVGDNCDTTITKGDQTGPLFGVCLNRDKNTANCPIN